jgi:cysteine desulfurase
MARHYLDHASTSPLRPEAADAMRRWLDSPAGDPARMHEEGRIVRAAVEEAREQVALLLGVRPRQVVFTSGGTEAVHAAVWGALWDHPGGSVLCAGVEHSSVRQSSSRLARVVDLPVDATGRIDPDAVSDALRHNLPAALVHCQWANHEVGTVQPVAEVLERCHRTGATVHIDAAAAVGHVPPDDPIAELLGDAEGPDLVSVSAHKIGGPPGVGALVVRRGLRIEPLLVGSAQERGRRAGMENVSGIVGFGAAAAAAHAALGGEAADARRWTEGLATAVLAEEKTVQVGDPVGRVPHIVCFGIEGVEAEPVLLGLDRAGIAAHSGSACSSESWEPSPVLAAMGADPSHSLRLSTGWSTTDADVDALAAAFGAVVSGLRALRG